MDKPTILVVNPNTSEEMTAAIDRIAWEAAGASANVVTRRSLHGPHTIEGPLDAVLGAAGMLSKSFQAILNGVSSICPNIRFRETRLRFTTKDHATVRR